MKSKQFSFKVFALFGLATMFLMATGFAQNYTTTNVDIQNKTPDVVVDIKNLTPAECNPDGKTTQEVKVTSPAKTYDNQVEVDYTDPNFVYYTVSELPVYSEGKTELPLYVMQKARYPVEALKDKAEGIVVVQFIVEKDGSISNSKVINSVHPLLDKEALHVISTLKTFTPGKENGEAVRCYYTLPIPFLFNR
jgi:TonB family protein